MAQDEGPEVADEFINEPEAAAEAAMAVSATGALAPRIEGIAQMLVDHPSWRLTHFFNRAEPMLYAKANYRLAWWRAVGAMDNPVVDKEGKPVLNADGTPKKRGFVYPRFEDELIAPDRDARTSYKERTRIHLRDITKIFERGEPQRRGGIFSRR